MAVLGHVVPEALLGGPIALVKDGDRIIIDAASRTIDWQVDEDEKEARKKEWEASGKGALKVRRGILYRYARDVAVSGVSESYLCIADSAIISRPAKVHTVTNLSDEVACVVRLCVAVWPSVRHN